MPLSQDEVRALLAIAVAYDNRKPGEVTIAAWMEAADRGRWTFPAAVEAIHDHYAKSTDFLMPGHITTAVRAAMRQPAPFAELPPAEPTRQDRITSLIAAVARRLSWPRTPASSTSGDASLSVECPHCHATPGQSCGRTLTRGPRAGERVTNSQSHPSRIELAGGGAEAS